MVCVFTSNVYVFSPSDEVILLATPRTASDKEEQLKEDDNQAREDFDAVDEI